MAWWHTMEWRPSILQYSAGKNWDGLQVNPKWARILIVLATFLIAPDVCSYVLGSNHSTGGSGFDFSKLATSWLMAGWYSLCGTRCFALSTGSSLTWKAGKPNHAQDRGDVLRAVLQVWSSCVPFLTCGMHSSRNPPRPQNLTTWQPEWRWLTVKGMTGSSQVLLSCGLVKPSMSVGRPGPRQSIR